MPGHCPRRVGTARSTTAACSARRVVGTVPATTACSPRRTRRVGIATQGAVAAGTHGSLGLDLPAGPRAHQVVAEPGDPVAAVEVVDPVAHVDLRGRPQRTGRAGARPGRAHRRPGRDLRRGRGCVRAGHALDEVDDRLTDLDAGDPQGPGGPERVELAAPRGRRAIGDRRGIRRLGRRHDRRRPAAQQVGDAAVSASADAVAAADGVAGRRGATPAPAGGSSTPSGAPGQPGRPRPARAPRPRRPTRAGHDVGSGSAGAAPAHRRKPSWEHPENTPAATRDANRGLTRPRGPPGARRRHGARRRDDGPGAAPRSRGRPGRPRRAG